MAPYPKRIPYGMMNFIDVRESNCYYVDKTHYIEKIENANRFFFFIRPRRFGKSLTISMLHHYYNVLEKDKFEQWYGDLYIGKHPTSERGSYLVIYLNFAVVHGELGNYRSSLDAHCNTRFNSFCDIYAEFLPEGIKEGLNSKNGAVEQLDYLCEQCDKAGQQIYLFIDEYDHFTNQILSAPEHLDDYKSETHGTGYLRLFFDTVKSGTYSSIKRCFITGVSPVTMDDLTSGFNIGTNYSLSAEFNEMVGFTEAEVRDMLDYYATQHPFNHTTDELIELMKPWYDNYCFSQDSHGDTTMYNSNMVLYFVDNYIRNKGKIPECMVHDNFQLRYRKLCMLTRKDKNSKYMDSVIQELMNQGYTTTMLDTIFSIEKIAEPNNFASLLFYWGILTINGTIMGQTKLSIPNEAAREQFQTFLLKE